MFPKLLFPQTSHNLFCFLILIDSDDTAVMATVDQQLFNFTEDNHSYDPEAESYSVGLVMMFFFFIWNFFIGGQVTLILSFLLRGKCHESAAILICPHWLVGFIVPVGMISSAHSTKGRIFGILIVFVSVVVPYTFFFIYHNRTNEELRQHPLICLSCRRNNTIGNEYPDNDSDQIQVESKIKDELDDLLIYKKVRSSHDFDDIEQSSNTKNSDDGETTLHVVSFRTNHPKTDLYIRPTELSKSCPHSSAVNPSSVPVVSVKLCAICLDEYKVGDTIAYSKNPNCHHEFHKECIFRVLQLGKHRKEGDCPICRNSYYDFLQDVELG